MQRIPSTLMIPALLALAATAALAGQVRINVASNLYSPSSATINLGDHAVWVWTSGFHSVSSGSLVTGALDGIFDNGTIVSNGLYSWKSATQGALTYYCQQHGTGMGATLNVVASGASVSDFRITKVQFGNTGGMDFVEIANIGPAAGNLGMYRLRVSGGSTITLRKAPTNLDLSVPSGRRVVIYIHRSGASTDTSVYVPSVLALPTTGSLALYVPSTGNTALSATDQMIDYVSWGAGGQENEATAVSAGFWTTNAAIQNVAAGHTIAFCGAQGGQYGVNHWSEITTPNFGVSSADCTTPAIPTSWGRIKTLYR